MNKTIASLSIVALSSLLLAGCTKPGTPTTQTPAKTVSEANEFVGAMESGQPTICTMTKGDDLMEYSLKNKLMRMKTKTTTTNDQGVATTTIGHMINDTKYLYIWDDQTKQGSKMAIPTEEETKQMAQDAKKYQEETSSTPKFDSEADYQKLSDEGYTIDCKTSIIDDSVFTPPSNIKFIDPTQMMKAIPSPDAMGNIDMSKLEELQKQYGGE
jgi:hypothetical protein